MKAAQDIIIKPIITEESMTGIMMKKYTFKVAKDAGKIEIKKAVEELFPGTKVKKVNTLIKDIQRNPFEGIGKPEALKKNLSGLWSRRIDDTNRIVYYQQGETIYIIACKGHYED